MALDPRSALVHRLKFLSVVQELAKADFDSAIDTVGLDSLEEISGGIGLLPRGGGDSRSQSMSPANRYTSGRRVGGGGGSSRQPLEERTRYSSNHYNIHVNNNEHYEEDYLSEDGGRDLHRGGGGYHHSSGITKPSGPRLYTTERGRKAHPGETTYADASTEASLHRRRHHHSGGNGQYGSERVTRTEILRQQARRDREARAEMERREREHGVGAQEAGWDSRFFTLPTRDAINTERRGSTVKRKAPPPLAAQDIFEEEDPNMYARLPRSGSGSGSRPAHTPPPLQRVPSLRAATTTAEPHAATYSGYGVDQQTKNAAAGGGEQPNNYLSATSGAAGHVIPRITFSSSGDLKRAASASALLDDNEEPITRFNSRVPSANHLLATPIATTGLVSGSNSFNFNASTSGFNDTSRSCATPINGSRARSSTRGPKAKPKPSTGGGVTPVNIPLSPAVPEKVVDRVAQVMRDIGKQSDFSKLPAAPAKKLDSTMSNLKSAIDARIDSAVNEHMADLRRNSSQYNAVSPDQGSASAFMRGGESFNREGLSMANSGGGGGAAADGGPNMRMYSPTRNAIVSREQQQQSGTFGTYASIRTSDSPFESMEASNRRKDGDGYTPEKSQNRSREYSQGQNGDEEDHDGSRSPYPDDQEDIHRRQQQRQQREEISHLSDLLDQMLGDHAMVQLRSEKGLARLLEGDNAEEQDEVDKARMMRLKRMQNELTDAMHKTEEIADGDDRAAQAELELDRIRRQLVEQDKEEERRSTNIKSIPSPKKGGGGGTNKTSSSSQRGFIPTSTLRSIHAAQAAQHETLKHNEDQWNTSSTSQYAFSARLTEVLLDDLVGELGVEMDSLLGEYVDGLAAHELQ